MDRQERQRELRRLAQKVTEAQAALERELPQIFDSDSLARFDELKAAVDEAYKRFRQLLATPPD